MRSHPPASNSRVTVVARNRGYAYVAFALVARDFEIDDLYPRLDSPVGKEGSAQTLDPGVGASEGTVPIGATATEWRYGVGTGTRWWEAAFCSGAVLIASARLSADAFNCTCAAL